MDLFIDVETTGLYEFKHGIWQIAAILFDNEGESIAEFNRTCCIFETQECDPKALSMNNLTEEDIFEMNEPEIVYADLLRILDNNVDKFNKRDKIFFYAYNAPFDHRFMRQFFYNNGNRFFGSYFHMPIIDVMVLAGEGLKDRIPNMKNFKQGTVAEELGIQVDQDKLHDALYDIRLTKQIYDELQKLKTTVN